MGTIDEYKARKAAQDTRRSSSQSIFRRLFSDVVTSSLGAAIILAALSYVYTTFDNRRKERLEFVRGQITKLYGPLYTLSATSESLWSDLGRHIIPKWGPVHPFSEVKNHRIPWQDDVRLAAIQWRKTRENKFHCDNVLLPGMDNIAQWRRFLRNVVMPLNKRIEETLLSSEQTIHCSRVRTSLHKFFAFSESVRLRVSTWEEDDKLGWGDRVCEANLVKAKYPHRLSRMLYAELDALHRREERLDSVSAMSVWWR